MRRDSKLKTESLKVRKLVAALPIWFSQNARDLPWRRTRDPYAIWVSEIMLQQTQVKTVLPYWTRWMRELPTIEAVACASDARLHKLWEGLGYYTRVRNLQKAARVIVEKHGNRFPEEFDDILALPGIGRYTAGAICSIAFNQPKPILDGNVTRVLTRLFGIYENPREKKTNAKLWQFSERLVTQASRTQNPYSSIWHLNQSLMELGALICIPRAPQCEICPVRGLCAARCRGWQEKIPAGGQRADTISRRVLAFVVEQNGKFLVRQRPAGVVNAHLWEFPNVEALPGTSPAAASQRLFGQAPHRLAPYCVVKHSITRYRITLESYCAELSGKENGPPGRWLTLSQLRRLAFTAAHKKILVRIGTPISESA